MGRWDEVDPRVQWAMDELDFDGSEPSSLLGQVTQVGAFGLLGGALYPFHNWSRRRPLYAGFPLTILGLVGGFGLGWFIRDYRSKNAAKEMAVFKHYIMTHPDKFPEPERKKFGDRVVFMPWRQSR